MKKKFLQLREKIQTCLTHCPFCGQKIYWDIYGYSQSDCFTCPSCGATICTPNNDAAFFMYYIKSAGAVNINHIIQGKWYALPSLFYSSFDLSMSVI